MELSTDSMLEEPRNELSDEEQSPPNEFDQPRVLNAPYSLRGPAAASRAVAPTPSRSMSLSFNDCRDAELDLSESASFVQCAQMSGSGQSSAMRGQSSASAFAQAFQSMEIPEAENDSMQAGASASIARPPPPRPVNALNFLHPNTLVTGRGDGVAFSALLRGTVRQTGKLRTPIVAGNKGVLHVAATLFVPCMRRSDPITLSHDIGMMPSFGSKRNNASVKLFMCERLTVLLSLPRIMQAFPDSTTYSAINMLKDRLRYNSVTAGVVFMVNFRAPAHDLNTHLQESSNLFLTKPSAKLAQAQATAIYRAMCMSVTSMRAAMVLRRDLGSITTRAGQGSHGIFSYLPQDWLSALLSRPAVRTAVLQHFENIYSVCEPTGWRQEWAPTEFTIDPMHGLTSLGFQEWFRDSNAHHMNNGHSLAKGFCSMMAVVGSSVYNFTTATNVYSEESLMQQALGNVDEFHVNALMDASSVLPASLMEARVFGADEAMCSPDFFFREQDHEFGFANEAASALPANTAPFVSPHLFIPRDALMACCSNQMDEVFNRALEASHGYITEDNTATATASLVVAIIPAAFAYANCIFNRALQFFGPASRDHYIKGFEVVISANSGDAQSFAAAVETSWANAMNTVLIGIEDKNLASHPLSTMQGNVLQHNLLDTATVLSTLTSTRNSKLGLKSSDRVFSLTSGPLRIVTPFNAASTITDTVKANMIVGSNNIPWWTSLMEMDELGDTDEATLKVALDRVAETLSENAVSNWELMRSVAARYGYRKGAISSNAQHAAVAFCELQDSVEQASTTDWTTVQQSGVHNRNLPESILTKKIPPHLVVPDSVLPWCSDMMASSMFAKEIIDSVHDSGRGVGLYGCGERAVFIRMAQLTGLFHVNMAAHTFTSGVTTTGKSATVQTCAAMGLKGLAITVDSQTAGATDTRNEDRMHRIIIMEEVSVNIVGRDIAAFASKMGANAGSQEQTTMLRVLEHAETVRHLKERVEIKTTKAIKTDHVITSTFKVVPSRSNQQCTITTTSNIEGSAIAAPIVARMWMVFFTATKPAGLPPAKLDRIGSTGATRMCDILGLAIIKFQMGARVGEYPPIDYSAVSDSICLIADECEKAFAGGQRHTIASLPFCVSPLVARVSTNRHTQTNGEPSSSTNVIYSRERLKDQLCTLFTQLSTIIRLVTVTSWLSVLISLAPPLDQMPLEQGILQVYGVAGPEDVIFSTFMLGTFDTLLVASDNTRLARVFAMPCVQAFVLALAMYSYSMRWCLDQHTRPDDTPDQRKSRLGPTPKLSATNTSSHDVHKTITPTDLLEAIVDMDSPHTLFHQLLHATADYFFQPDMIWLVNIATRFTAQVCTLMHPSKVRYPRTQIVPEVQRGVGGPLPITPLRAINTPLHTPGTPAFTLRHQVQSPATNRFSLFTSRARPAPESKESTNFSSFFTAAALPVAIDTAAASSSAVLPAADSNPALQYGLSMLNDVTRDSAAAGTTDTHHESVCITMCRVVSDAGHLLKEATQLWERVQRQSAASSQERNLVSLGEQLQGRVSQPSVMYVLPTQSSDTTPALIHAQLQALWLSSGEYLCEQIIDADQVIRAFQTGNPLPSFVQFMHDADQCEMASNMPSRSAAEEKLLDLERWPQPSMDKAVPPLAAAISQSAPYMHGVFPMWRPGMPRLNATQSAPFNHNQTTAALDDHIDHALNTLMNAHDTQNVMKLTDLVPQKLAYVVTSPVAQHCGYTTPSGCVVVILRPTQLHGSKTSTERGLESAMHIMAQPNYKGPRIFTYPFYGHVPSNDSDGVLRLKRIEPIHDNGTCTMIFDAQSSVAISDRLTKAIEVGPLDETDKLSRRVDNITDATQFILEKRKQTMPGTAALVERSLREALCIYSYQLHPNRDAEFHSQQSARWWPMLEMCFLRSPDAIQFITNELKMVDPTRLKTYTETHQRQMAHTSSANTTSIFSSKRAHMQNLMQQMTFSASAENQRKLQSSHTHASAQSIAQRMSRPTSSLNMSEFVRLNAAVHKSRTAGANTAVASASPHDGSLGGGGGDDEKSDAGDNDAAVGVLNFPVIFNTVDEHEVRADEGDKRKRSDSPRKHKKEKKHKKKKHKRRHRADDSASETGECADPQSSESVGVQMMVVEEQPVNAQSSESVSAQMMVAGEQSANAQSSVVPVEQQHPEPGMDEDDADET